MFYPVESLRRGGRFYLCWVADSWPLRFATITQRQLWSQDVRDICDDLMEVMNRETGFATTRFSLRLSSQLMRGLVRLYQRKVVVFLGDLCMMNATVTKHINKKWGPHHSPQKRETWTHPRTPRRALVVEVPETEERVEERIQESGNVVANIDQITLKEAAIPEVQVPADGFGEENPEQAFQLLNDRTLEQMMGQGDGSVVQHSGLDLLLLDSLEKSHDKSRLFPHDPMHLQMERISELDMTMFRKSATVNDVLMNLEKDIPQIPDIPIADPPVPPPEKEVDPVKEKTPEPQELEVIVPIEQEKEKAPPAEIELEELEQEFQEPRRKRPKRLIIDKRIKSAGAMFRQRLDNVHVEMRCEDSSDDIVDALFVPGDIYMRRPTSAGWRVRSRVGYTLTDMFLRNLGASDRQKADTEIEQMLGMKPQRTRVSRDKIVDEEASKTSFAPAISLQQPSVIADETAVNISVQPVTAPAEQLDLADMPTQILLMTQDAAQKRSCEVEDLEEGVSEKRPCRRSGYVSFKKSQQSIAEKQQEKGKDLPIAETPKRPQARGRKEGSMSKLQVPKDIEEQIPLIIEPEFPEIRESQLNDQDREKQVSQLLEAAGLADATNVPINETLPKNGTQNKTLSKSGEDGSETPLGSLDRTKVDLGESLKTTDSQKFLRTEWGTQGTMLKVVKLLNKGHHPLTVRTLVDNGPVPAEMEKLVAARCFTALLKLKQHRFIILEKNATSLEVTDIRCGPKINM